MKSGFVPASGFQQQSDSSREMLPRLAKMIFSGNQMIIPKVAESYTTIELIRMFSNESGKLG